MIAVWIQVELLEAINTGIDAADRWLKTWGKGWRSVEAEHQRDTATIFKWTKASAESWRSGISGKCLSDLSACSSRGLFRMTEVLMNLSTFPSSSSSPSLHSHLCTSLRINSSKSEVKTETTDTLYVFLRAGPAESSGGCRNFNAMEDDVAIRMQIMVST